MKLAVRTRELSGSGPILEQEQSTPIPPAMLTKVREALASGETHYTSRPGIPALRAMVVEEITRLGGPTYDSGSGIVITAGEREGLFVTLLGLRLERGDALLAVPGACQYERLFRLMGLQPVTFVNPPPVTSSVRLVYREAGLADHRVHAESMGVAIREGRPDVLNVGGIIGAINRRPLPPIAAERTLLVGDLDALTGVGAFGVGFVAGPAVTMKSIRTWKQAFSICTAAPSQRAALVALEMWRKRVP